MQLGRVVLAQHQALASRTFALVVEVIQEFLLEAQVSQMRNSRGRDGRRGSSWLRCMSRCEGRRRSGGWLRRMSRCEGGRRGGCRLRCMSRCGCRRRGGCRLRCMSRCGCGRISGSRLRRGCGCCRGSGGRLGRVRRRDSRRRSAYQSGRGGWLRRGCGCCRGGGGRLGRQVATRKNGEAEQTGNQQAKTRGGCHK